VNGWWMSFRTSNVGPAVMKRKEMTSMKSKPKKRDPVNFQEKERKKGS